MSATPAVALEIRNTTGFPLPGIIQGITWVVFSFPLIVIPITFSEVAKNPKVLFFWIAVCIPLAVMFVLRRAFTRFAIALFEDGSLKITQPFSSQIIPREQLATIVAKTHQAHVGGAGRVAIPWLYFFDATDKQLARVSPAGFEGSDIERLLTRIVQVRPDVRLQRQ